MSITRLRIATRKSRLALWQAEHVRRSVLARRPGLDVELVPLTSTGDRIRDRPLSQVGGKGLFIKELEEAMLRGDADLAVHSMKDVPADLPLGFSLPVILERGDPFDAFVSNRHASLGALPEGACVGTSSLRRQALLRYARPDLRIESLRGNVHTRLERLDEGRFDAIVLACAGLRRLRLEARIRAPLAPEQCLPAVGQGAMGIELRADDAAVLELVAPLDHAPSHTRLVAERAFNARLGGSCSTPLAAFAELDGERLRVRGVVGMPDGSRVIRDEISGAATQAQALGTELAERLLARGADDILAAVTA